MTTSPDDPQITTEDAEGGRVVKVTGELDLASAPTLAEKISASPVSGESVTLDLSGVTFIDSSALRALVVAGRELADAGAKLLIGPRSAVVDRVLAVTQLDQQSEVFQVISDPA